MDKDSGREDRSSYTKCHGQHLHEGCNSLEPVMKSTEYTGNGFSTFDQKYID